MEGYFGDARCAYCGASFGHEKTCPTLYRPSLQAQRETTKRLREELVKTRQEVAALSPPKPPKADERTDVQKRFDAIAEELADTDE